MCRWTCVVPLLLAAAYPSWAVAGQDRSLVPGRASQVTSITVRVETLPEVCTGMACPTPTTRQRPRRPRTVVLRWRARFSRFTHDINALPPWEYSNGCEVYGDGARWYHIVFHYRSGAQWTITVDRGPIEEMVFANSGDAARTTCVSLRDAARLNQVLDQVFGRSSPYRA